MTGTTSFFKFLIKLTSKFRNFVGTLPTRYVTGEDERRRVGKLLCFYKIYPRIGAIEFHVATRHAHKREN
jgi:hypothetical protein